jgi:hypothetical protein
MELVLWSYSMTSLGVGDVNSSDCAVSSSLFSDMSKIIKEGINVCRKE